MRVLGISPWHRPRCSGPRSPRPADSLSHGHGSGSHRLSKVGEDVTETLEVIPRQWKVIETVREKFTCRNCEKLSQPPAPFHAVSPCVTLSPDFSPRGYWTEVSGTNGVKHRSDGLKRPLSTLNVTARPVFASV